MIGDIRKFRFWCQKVLPLVYDDSLSYYEVLCKVVQYLNNIIEDVNTIPEYIDAVIDAKVTDEHIMELLGQLVADIKSAISSNDEGTNTNSSTDYNVGQMLWWNGKLYSVIRQIDAGDTFIVDTNIALVNFEDLFNDFVDEVKHDISANDEGGSPTATQTWSTGTWLWIDNVLYEATSTITQGNAFVFSGENANVSQITIEDAFKSTIGDLSNLVTTNKDNVVNAINEVSGHAGSNTNKIGDLSTLVTTDKSNLVGAVNEVSGHAGNNTIKIGDLSSLVTTDKSNLVGAVNEVSAHAGSNTNKIGDLSNLNTTDKSSLVGAINEANGNAAGARKLRNRKAILISDSYGVSPSIADNWEEKFEANTGIPCLKFAYSGKGFYTNDVNSILADFSAETVADKNTYTDIIACLGANDICTCDYSDISNLIQAIKDFVAYCNTNYPNAIVYIGCIGYTRYGTTYAGTASVTNYLNVLKAYKDGASQAGAHYLNGVEMVMHYYPYFSTADWLHPTSAGASKLASAIANAYINGSANMSGDGEFFRVTPVTGQINSSASETLAGLCYIEDENTYWEGATLSWVYSDTLATLNDGYYDFATINPTSILGNGSPIDIAMEAIVISDLNAYAGYKSIPVVVRIQSGHVYIRSRYTDGTGTIPTVSCNTIVLAIPRIDIATLIN